MLHRITTIILIFLFGYGSVFSQFKIDSTELPKMYSILKKVNPSAIKECNIQFEIGFPPDVCWRIETKNACITKLQVLSLMKYFQTICKNAGVKNIDNNLLD